MRSKQDIIDTITPTKTYIGSFVIEKINSVELDDRYVPEVLRRGDVITGLVGVKRRPLCIVTVKSDYVIAIPLTSGVNVNSLTRGSSRFFGESYFTNSFEVVPIELAKKNYAGVYDNPKFVKKAIENLKLFIAKNLK